MQNNTYKEIISNIESLKPKFVNLGLEARELDSTLEFLNNKVRDWTPKIMLYGNYNAGKSSLVNALLGKVEAKVGDAPETKSINSYNFETYKLYDTPGLNAPIEHEKITKTFYRECEIIIFVISSENIDDEKIYTEIKQISDDNKPVILTLNNKQSIDGEDLQRVINGIYKNLARRDCKITDIDNKIGVYVVNANSALKAKIEGKMKLLESSGITELENRIKEIMKNNNVDSIMNNCNQNISNFVNHSMSMIDNKLDDKIMQQIEGLITELKKIKDSKNYELEAKINEKIESLRGDIMNNLDINSSTESTINAILQSHTSILESMLSRECENIAQEVKSSAKKVQIECEKLETQISQNSNTSSGILNAIESTSKIAGAIILAPLPIPPQIKAIIASVATIANAILGVAKSVFGNNKAMEQENENRVASLLQLRNRVSDIISSIRINACKMKNEAIDSIINPVLARLENERSEANNTNTNLLNLKKELEILATKLPKI